MSEATLGGTVDSSAEDFPSEFRAAILKGVLLLRRCRDCGSYNPLSVTALCDRCGSTNLVTTSSTGRCTVLSRTYLVRPADAGAPRIVLFVKLEEGPRILGVAVPGIKAEFDEPLSFAHCDPVTGALFFGPRKDADATIPQSVSGILPESTSPVVG